MILLVECLLLCLLCQLAPVLPERKHPERKRWIKALLAFGTAILLGLFLHLINGAWSFWQGLWESGVLALLFIWYRTLILFWLPERRRKNPEGAKAALKKGERQTLLAIPFCLAAGGATALWELLIPSVLPL